MSAPRLYRASATGLTWPAAALAAAALLQPAALTAQAARPGPASERALARVRALNGAMPPSFDLSLDDPCAGVWDISDPAGRLRVTVVRYAGLSLAHIVYPSGASLNVVVSPLAAHTIRFELYAASYTMQCTAGGAILDRALGHDHRQLAVSTADLSAPPEAARNVPPMPAPALPRACDDPAALQSLRKQENEDLRHKGTMITLVQVLNPSTLHRGDGESRCLGVAVFSDDVRLPITYTITFSEISWNVDAGAAPAAANPLLGDWVGMDGPCNGARWTFLPSSLTIYPAPGDKRSPKTFDKVSYAGRDNDIVEVLVNGRRNSTFLVKDGMFANGNCIFRHQ